MDAADYAAHDALGLADLVRRGETTATELLEAAIARADAVDGPLNAIVRRDEDAARARASEAPEGTFGGVPFLLKDLGQWEAGRPTSCGSRSMARVVQPETSTVVQRWRAAGLVSFGRTNTPEFGAKAITESEHLGAARNPWDTSRTPGGSSGGAAAAVAAGVVPAAGASDGGGSIRIPAGCCGLFGLKPGRGLLPTGPVEGELIVGSATEGAITRSVRDAAAMLDVLAGADPVAPYLPAVPGGAFLDEVGRPPGRLRIGFCTASTLNPAPDPEAVAAVRSAAELLEELGHDVVEVPTPVDDGALAKEFLVTWFVNAAVEVATAKRLSDCGDEGFEQDTLIMAAIGRRTSGTEYVEALEGRHAHVRRLQAFHDEHHLLLTPTLATPPVRVGELATPESLRRATEVLLRTRTAGPLLSRLPIVDRIVDANLGWVPYTQLANVTGRPACSVPLHWTAGGLPLGVQLVAPLGGEGLLLRLGAQLEEARPWVDRRPSV